MKKSWRWIVPLLGGLLICVTSFCTLVADDFGARDRLSRQAFLQALKIQQLFLDRHREQLEWLSQQSLLIRGIRGEISRTSPELTELLKTSMGMAAVEVVYAVDLSGKIVLSSQEDYVGLDLGQRPYVVKALTGGDGVFLGRGVATKSRGIYLSVPVRQGSVIVGALAFRAPAASLDKLFLNETTAFVEAEDGTVFSATNLDWIYRQSHLTVGNPWEHSEVFPLDWNWRDHDRNLTIGRDLYRAASVEMSRLASSRLWILEKSTPPWVALVVGNLIALILYGALLFTVRNASLARQRHWQIEQAQHMRSLFENSLVAMATFNNEGLLTWANNSFVQLTEPMAQLYGRRFADLWAKDLQIPWKEVFEGQRTWISFDGFFNTRLESWVPVSAGLSLVKTVGTTLWKDRTFLLTLLDMSERNEVEEALRQSQKLASLGQLAGGIAHDFNNILGSLGAMAELIKASLTTDDESIQESVDILISGFAKASGLAEKLLTFARQSPRHYEVLDIRGLLKDLKFLGPSSRSQNLRMRWVLPDEGLWVKGDPSLLTSVFLNLAVNAADAMADGGDLVISGFVENDKVVVKFKDNGMGIPAENLNRIFEPFFTTKGNRGTGLGLSLAKRTIVEHKGNLTVESQVGEGTVMTIKLPLAHPE